MWRPKKQSSSTLTLRRSWRRRAGNHEGVKPGVVFFGEAAPAYINLHRIQVEMRGCDLFLAVGSAFEVVPPETMLPWDRQNKYPRNFLVDPSPSRSEIFGVVEAKRATFRGLSKSSRHRRRRSGHLCCASDEARGHYFFHAICV
ncbi:Sir2 family NAD-dependent protein deacetylase [Caballeronia grimmiae]|uniref:Sir2 family NAD-dependent protein deacetylase n=1 Tax=Caballeronia grimmiae TaxID=1071679 RepID=UPI0038B756EC